VGGGTHVSFKRVEFGFCVKPAKDLDLKRLEADGGKFTVAPGHEKSTDPLLLFAVRATPFIDWIEVVDLRKASLWIGFEPEVLRSAICGIVLAKKQQDDGLVDQSPDETLPFVPHVGGERSPLSFLHLMCLEFGDF